MRFRFYDRHTHSTFQAHEVQIFCGAPRSTKNLVLFKREALYILVGLTLLLQSLVTPKALAQASPGSEPLLQVQGVLESGDPTLQDGSFYDAYTFAGQAGQTVSITLESLEFDTYLMLYDAAGQRIAENDDATQTNRNAAITVTLLQNGQYRVLANAYAPGSQGRYTITIRPALAGQTAPTFSESITRQNEANQLLRQGNQQLDRSQFQGAMQLFQQALEIYQALGDRRGEANALGSLGLVQYSIGHYRQAIELFQQALPIQQASNDRQGEASTLGNLGNAYADLGQYQQAREFYQQILAIFQELGDRARQGGTLNNLGEVSRQLGDYSQALDFYQQGLAIARATGDRQTESEGLNNMGIVYRFLSQYQQAIDVQEQSLAIARLMGNRQREGSSLGNLGDVYGALGQQQRAIDYYQQALAIAREIGDLQREGNALNNLGVAYDALQQYSRAIDYHQQALNIKRQIGDRQGEANALNNLGSSNSHLKQYPAAAEFYQQALTIYQAIGDRLGTVNALNNLGVTYRNLDQEQPAIQFYQQGLTIAHDIGARELEGILLGNMGLWLKAQQMPELAIVFFKRSVNVTEAIRQDIQGLSSDLQQSYVQTISDTYRNLADLLLQQNRVFEAQQVLDLLKVQELENYLQDVQGNAQTAQGLEYWPAEQQILDQYERSPDQPILTFATNPEVVALTNQLQRTARGQNLNPNQLVALQDNLRTLQHAVLLYPLVLDDRLELVLITPNAPPIRRTVPITKVQLTQAIADFRAALVQKTRNSTVPAQQLYQWLIQPIEADLTQAQAETIIYAADGALRYIPLAALYDGQQWLIQRFRIDHITAASLTDFTDHADTGGLTVLVGAFTEGYYSFNIGDQTFGFSGLPHAQQEVINIAAEIPNTTELLNQQFSLAGTLPQMNRYSIVHLATHAEFLSGQPEDSFILFGNGDRANLRDIASWRLPNVDLVVLSACRTAVSGELGNGEEILGFGYQMQRTGVRAAIASLWYVDDGGTQLLMTAFYAALKRGNISKAEALRQAQIALITGNYAALGLDHHAPPTHEDFNRPYYWAPFILIGNGL